MISFPIAAGALEGRTALVTGGAKRIGRGIALALAEAGADVAITYNRSISEAEKTVADLRALGVRSEGFPCELHRPESIREAVGGATAWAGGGSAPALDLLVNNAGSFETVPFDDLTPEQWDAMFATNTRAPFFVAQAALPALRASRHTGRIVNLGSLGGLRPWATHAHYCASKAALHMLTQTMSKAWAPRIAVNCVAPGMIVTGSEGPDDAYAHLVSRTPMGRNGTVADIADVVLYLACATPFLTGQILAVDGGLGL